MPRRGAQMSDLAIIPDGAVLIRNGRIDSVGPTRRLERLKTARNAQEIDATGSVVLPGFVDTGTSLILADAKRGIIELQTVPVLSNMVRHGTTTVEVSCACDMRRFRIYSWLQSRPVSLVLSVSPGAVELETVTRLKLARAAVALEPGHTDHLRNARAAGFHTAVEARDRDPGEAMSAAFQSEAASLRGLGTVSEASVRFLAESTMVVECRQARLLIDSGGALSLGSGFHPMKRLNYNIPYLISQWCAELGISEAEGITATTVNAAFAAGCGPQCGSVEPGKWADLVLYEASDYRSIFETGAVNRVSRVVRHGKTIYRRGKVECG